MTGIRGDQIRWVGPETKRIPQPVPDPKNPGHFMDEDDVESEDEEFESEEAESDNDFVFADLDEQSSPSATIQFISDEKITAVVVQGP